MSQQSNTVSAKPRLFLVVLAVVLAAAVGALAAGGGVYWWQKSVANKLVQELERRVESLQKQGGASQSETKPAEYMESVADEVIRAIKNKNMKKLSTFVHPDKGVRFSPYAYVDVQNDLVFTASQIRRIWEDKNRYSWGQYAGSGQPINLTFKGYYKEFVYDQDFANANQVSYNSPIGRSNTINNSSQVYPNSLIVEYHFPGSDPQYGGMDWKSLRLVFEKESDTWHLIGVIHDEWTP